MIKPTSDRVLVRKIPRYGEMSTKLNLTLVDGKKHFDGVRRGEVISVGPYVREISQGDVVVFRGDSGYTFDYDPENREVQDTDNASLHWLREKDCLALEMRLEGMA